MKSTEILVLLTIISRHVRAVETDRVDEEVTQRGRRDRDKDKEKDKEKGIKGLLGGGVYTHSGNIFFQLNLHTP